MSTVHPRPPSVREADRILEVVRTSLSIIQRDYTVLDAHGRDVTAEVIDDRARNLAQALVGVFVVRPRHPLATMTVELNAIDGEVTT